MLKECWLMARFPSIWFSFIKLVYRELRWYLMCVSLSPSISNNSFPNQIFSVWHECNKMRKKSGVIVRTMATSYSIQCIYIYSESGRDWDRVRERERLSFMCLSVTRSYLHHVEQKPLYSNYTRSTSSNSHIPRCQSVMNLQYVIQFFSLSPFVVS